MGMKSGAEYELAELFFAYMRRTFSAQGPFLP